MDAIKSFRRKFKTQKDIEDNSEEYTEETEEPLVRARDAKGFVKVEIFIPGLVPGRDKYHPKGGRIYFDIFNNGYGLDVTTELKDTTKKVKTILKYNVQQLPGRVDKREKKFVVEKGKIIITLEKHQDDRNIDWDPAIDLRGLDQLSSSSSSDDD